MKSNLEIFNLDDLCRLCLNQLGAVNMFKPTDITKDILISTGVKILMSDALPQSICKKCFCMIKDAIKLRNVSQRNDARLRGLMGDPEYSNEVSTNHNSKPQEGQEPPPACKPCSSMSDATSNSSEIQRGTKKQYNKKKSKESIKNDSPVPYDISEVGNKPKRKYNTKKNRSLLKQKNNFNGSNKAITARNDIYVIPTEMSPKVANIKTEYLENNEMEFNQVENNIKIEVTEVMEHVPDESSFTNESLNSDVTDDRLLIPTKKRRLSSDEDTEFTYECETCLKVFPSRKRLVVHLRNHNKTFTCSIVGCQKSFACSHDLQKHVRCHTGEKPFQCKICLKCFTQNGTLKYHKTRVQPCSDYYKALESNEMILSDLPSLDSTMDIEKWLPRMPTLEAMLKQPIEPLSTTPIEVQTLPDLPNYVQSTTPIEVQNLPDLPNYVQSTTPIEVQTLPDLPIEVQSITPIEVQSFSDLPIEVQLTTPTEVNSLPILPNEPLLTTPIETQSLPVSPIEMQSTTPIEVQSLQVSPIEMQSTTPIEVQVATFEGQITEKAEPISSLQILEMIGIPEQLPSSTVPPSEAIDT